MDLSRKAAKGIKGRCPHFLICFLFIFVLGHCTSEAAVEEFLSKGDSLKTEFNVLFIGNSFIFFNDLPGTLSELAEAGDYTIKAQSIATPGWTLEQHAQSQTTLSKIAQQHWDYVVLQEQSVLPIYQRDRRQRMYPAARILQKKAQRSGAKVILLMTWGRKNGLKDAGYRNFNQMQTALTEGYREVASKLDAIVAPVGVAWKNVLAEKPFFPLWRSDGSHPSKQGTYLAACVLYSTMIKESSEGIDFASGLSRETNAFLQGIASKTVLEDVR